MKKLGNETQPDLRKVSKPTVCERKIARLLHWVCFSCILADGYPDFCTSRRFSGNFRCLSLFPAYILRGMQHTERRSFYVNRREQGHRSPVL